MFGKLWLLLLWFIVSSQGDQVTQGKKELQMNMGEILAEPETASCYWTSTIIYGNPISSLTYAGISSTRIASVNTATTTSASNTVYSTSTTLSSSPSTTSSSTNLYTNPLYLRVDTGGSKLLIRALLYVAFSGDDGYLTDIQEAAALFYLKPSGNLLSEGKYVGVMSDSGTEEFQRFNTPPADGYNWGTTGSGQLAFGNASFCYTDTGQLYVVLDTASPDCMPATIMPQVEAGNGTFAGSSAVMTWTSSSAGPTSSATGETTSLASTSSTTPASASTPSTSQSTALTSFSTFSSPTSALVTVLTSTSTSTSSSLALVTTLTSSPAPTSSTVSSIVTSIPLPASSPPVPLSITAATPPPLSTSISISLGNLSTNILNNSVVSLSTLSLTTTSLSSSSGISSVSTFSPVISIPTTNALPPINNTIIPTLPTSSQTVTPTSSTSSPSYSPTAVVYLAPAKRGLAYGNVNTTQFYTPPSQVSWAYNYFSLPNTSTNNGIFPNTLYFIPTLYNDASSLTSIWSANVNYSIANYGTDTLFSFNEPDACYSGQSACMSVNRSIIAYQKFIQPFAGIVKLGAPAVTNSGPPAGLTWLSWFLGNATQLNLTVDFINIHWYASPYNLAYFESYVGQAYAMGGGRPVYVTEYGMDQSIYNEAAVQTFIMNTTAWLDKQSYVPRYAWFGNYANNLLNVNATGLSARGMIWTNYTG